MGAEKYQIIIQGTEGDVSSVDIPAEGVLRLGSSSQCEVRILHAAVLPIHCYLKSTAGHVYLIVKDPQALAFVNGQPATKVRLQSGDSLTLGDRADNGAFLRYEVREDDPLLQHDIGGYVLEERIGVGGTGTVYRATQLSLNRTVAVKILAPELTRDQAFIERFLNEAQSIARLNHPNVVQIYDAARIDDLFFFSMEYLTEGTLGDLLKREKALDPEIALRAMQEAAMALMWAEEQGIIHRDIKPDNLLISSNGTIKIADLGLAIEAYDTGTSTGKRRWAGSPRFIAPEQALGEPIDHRVDIYALGCTLFRALTGRHLFSGSTAAEIIKKKISNDPPPLELIMPQVPEAVAGLVNTMVARDPADRYTSCREMLEAIENAITSLEAPPAGVASPVPTPQPRHAASSPPTPVRAPARNQMALIWTMAAIALVCCILLIAVILKFRSAEPEMARQPDPAVDEGATLTMTGEDPDEYPLENPLENPLEDLETPSLAEEDTRPRLEERPERTVVTPGLEDPAFNQLQNIIRRYQKGLLDQRDAIARLEDFKKLHTDSQYQTAADFHLKNLRKELAEWNRKEVLAQVQKKFTPLFKAGKLREARALLDTLIEKFPENRSNLLPFLTRVEEAASAAWNSVLAEADQLMLAAKFLEARERLEKSADELPADYGSLIQKRLVKYDEEEQEYRECFKSLDRNNQEFSQAIAALDFIKAAGLEATLPVYSEQTSMYHLVDRTRARFLEETRLCKGTWGKLRAEISNVIRAKKKIPLDAAERPLASVDSYQVLSLNGAMLTLNKAGREKGAEPTRHVLAISNAQLIRMIENGVGGNSSRDTHMEGLGLLLLYSNRPQRAATFLQREQLGAEKTGVYARRIARATEATMTVSLQAISGQLGELRAKKETVKNPATLVPRWNALLEEVSRFVSTYRKAPGYKEVREVARTAYLLARSETLRPGIPKNLFHGKVKSYRPSTGQIELSYQFSSENELLDFVPKLKTGCKSSLIRKTMKVQGEYRFSRGDPFINRLTVTGVVPPKGYKQSSPNINVGMWTLEEDRLTPIRTSGSSTTTGTGGRGTGGTSTGGTGTGGTGTGGTGSTPPAPTPPARDPGGIPEDYFVFGIGMRTQPTYSSSTYYYDYLKIPGLNTIVPMPANVVFGGRRGKSIRSYPDSEGIWGVGVVNKIKGRQVFQVHLDAGKAIWAINGRPVSMRKSMYLDRFQRSEPYSGSFSLFTNGEYVHYDTLTIESELNPIWVEKELARRAQDEFASLEKSAR